jgi:hypothetical protein
MGRKAAISQADQLKGQQMKPKLAVDNEAGAPLSPARIRLHDLLTEQDRARARIEDLQASRLRLDEVFDARDKAAEALSEFDRDAAAAMLSWSRSSGSAPNVDAEHRARLLAALTVAQENAAAASAAKAELDREVNAASQAMQTLDVPISEAVAEVIFETAVGPMIDDLQEAVAVAVGKQTRLKAAFDAIIGIAHAGPDFAVMKPVFNIAEQLSETLRKAAAPPAPDSTPAYSAWTRFVADLRIDPGAQVQFS